jgi:hypothetical protein
MDSIESEIAVRSIRTTALLDLVEKADKIADLVCELASVEYDGQDAVLWVKKEDLPKLKKAILDLLNKDDYYDISLEDEAETLREMEVAWVDEDRQEGG